MAPMLQRCLLLAGLLACAESLVKVHVSPSRLENNLTVLPDTGMDDSRGPMFFGMFSREVMETRTHSMPLVNYNRFVEGIPTWLTALTLGLWTAVLIWMLNTTAQEFFVPPLVYWSRLLNLRPEVAGATLVALGNGSPDVFSCISAGGAQDLPLAFSEMLGATITVNAVVGGTVLLVYSAMRDRLEKEGKSIPPDLQVQPIHYVESASFLLVALVYIALKVQTGSIGIWGAMVMPGLYLLYIAELTSGPNDEGDATTLQYKKKADLADGEVPPLEGMVIPSDLPPLQLLGRLLAWPTYAIRWVLIPPSDEYWDRTRRVVSSLAPTGLVLLIATIGKAGFFSLFSSTWGGCQLFCAALVSASIYRFSDDGPDVPRFYPALTLTAKVSSILVIAALGNEVTACMETLTTQLHMPQQWLGATVVAWGCSIPDLVVNLAMTQQGQARVAFTAVFAGPLFSCLVGLGFGLGLAAKRAGGTIRLWTDANQQLGMNLQLGFCGVGLAALWWMLLHAQHLPPRMPYVLFFIYAVSLITILTESKLLM